MGVDTRGVSAAEDRQRGARYSDHFRGICGTAEWADEFLFLGVPYVDEQH